jgi:archaellum component FlaF (FlaF/FlaG flagellin family)
VNQERICFSSKTIELSENENYIELTNRVCYYDAPNLNKVKLPYDETSLDKAQTLINMPVVAKYTTNAQGEPTFKGHEVYYDEDGNVYFGTDNIGTHYDVYIQDDTVITDLNGTTQTLPCLFARYRIWKRNQNVVDAVHRLYNEGKLYSSWEIETISYQYDNGIKTLTDYIFLSNCLLGYEYSYPAYGEDAKAIQMSQKDSQLLVAEAFSKDLIKNKSILNINSQKEDGESVSQKDKKIPVSASKDGVVPKNISTKKAPEDEEWSAPTLSDFTDKTWKDLSDDEKNNIAEHYAWAKEMPPINFGDLKLPHHRPSDGAVVWAAVANAAARLNQTNLPSGIIDKVKSHIEEHYKQFGKESPWKEESSKMDKKSEKPEKAELTDSDIRKSLYDAIAKKLGVSVYDISIIANIPNSNTCWVQRWNRENNSDLDVLIFTYTIENDVVTVSDPQNGKLTVSISAINDTVAELNSTIEKQNASLVEANTKIQDLNKENSELLPYKESCEKAEQERIEQELAEKRKSLEEYALKSKLISKDEISSVDRIKNCIENVDEKGLKTIIAERFMESLDKNPNIETSGLNDNDKKDVEMPKGNIVNGDESNIDYKSAMKSYLDN